MPLRRYLAEVGEAEHEAFVNHLHATVTRQEMLLMCLVRAKLADPKPRFDEIRGPFWQKLTVPEILTREDGPVKPLSDEDYEHYSKQGM